MKDVKLAAGVSIAKSIFDSRKKEGEPLEMGGRLSFDIPEGCTMIVLATNNGGGMVPYTARLPHQVYLKDVEKVFEETGAEVIHVIPVRSSETFNLAYNGEYGEQRWAPK